LGPDEFFDKKNNDYKLDEIWKMDASALESLLDK
jgi:hypothetical protein